MAFACLVFFSGRADTLTLPRPFTGDQRIWLHPWFTVLEDSAGTMSAAVLSRHPNLFKPLDSLHPARNTDYFWLRTELRSDSGQAAQDLLLSFTNLTYVDVYLFKGVACIQHRQIGAFRQRSDISEGDGRLYTSLPVEGGKEYTLLLQVHHTKHYIPEFDFSLQPKRTFYRELHRARQWDTALQGAICIFFLYTLLSGWVTRSKLYAWLLLFVAGSGGYVIGSGGYFIEWFFPEDPPTGWLFNVNFLDIGILGIYGLVADFWELKRNYPQLYRYSRWIPVLLAITSIGCVTLDLITGNFRLTNNINLWEHPLMFGFVIWTLRTCWSHLSHPQRYLAYGIVLFAAAGAFITLNSVFTHEKSLATAPLVADIAVLGVFLLFSTGLKEQMRQHEIDKQKALEELALLHQHQNVMLEKKVEERTEELNVSNRRLMKQKNLLAERNHKIETLINELNHRVKNNLQLLYSLLSLQLPMVKDETSRDILKGNIGKIRAMMLVNQKLFSFEKEGSINLCEFIGDLASHLQKIYDSKGRTRIEQNIPADIRLSDKHTLSFGLILSELFTNTFKHAFQDHPDPSIRVEVLAVNANLLQFIYADNGRGIQEGDIREKFTMGIPLIKDLTRQMNGKMMLSTEGGLSYSFTIPV